MAWHPGLVPTKASCRRHTIRGRCPCRAAVHQVHRSSLSTLSVNYSSPVLGFLLCQKKREGGRGEIHKKRGQHSALFAIEEKVALLLFLDTFQTYFPKILIVFIILNETILLGHFLRLPHPVVSLPCFGTVSVEDEGVGTSGVVRPAGVLSLRNGDQTTLDKLMMCAVWLTCGGSGSSACFLTLFGASRSVKAVLLFSSKSASSRG